MRPACGWNSPVGLTRAPYLQTADGCCALLNTKAGGEHSRGARRGRAVVAPDVGIAREAGAIVMPRSDLGLAVTEVLRTGARRTQVAVTRTLLVGYTMEGTLV